MQEREARLSKDEEKIRQVFIRMIEMCKNESEELSLMKMLSRRKGQLKIAFKWFVNHVFEMKQASFSKNMTKEGEVDSFILFCQSFLKGVIEGKMFLEKERMMVSSTLAQIYIERSNFKNAFDAVFDVPVETFGSVEEKDIIEFQLEQLRLSIVNEDWIRADICSKRIRKRYFAETKDKEREIKYNMCMSELHLGQKNYIEASRALLKVSESLEANKNVVLSSFFIILAPISEDRTELINLLILNKNNSEPIRRVLGGFLKKELLHYEDMNVFTKISYLDLSKFSKYVIRSVDSHNLFIISKFCTFVSVKDLSCLLQCKSEDIIEKLCWVVNNGLLECKIDQKKQLVRFNKSLEPDWMKDIDVVLDRIMMVNHMIHNETLKYTEESKS